MEELAQCCRELVVRSPSNSADLGAILIGYHFKTILSNHGLAIVPTQATSGMREAWNRKWFQNFSNRYSAMLAATWEPLTDPST